MSDVAIISICITVLVALLIVHFIIRSGRGLKLSGKTKFGDFGLETSEILQNRVAEIKQVKTEPKNVPVQVQASEINADYEQFLKFTRLLRHTTYQVSKVIVGYLMMNHVDLNNRDEFRNYVRDRVYDIIEVYNKSFLKSDDLLVKGLTVDVLLGEYNTVFFNLLKNAYGDMVKIYKSLPIQRGMKLDVGVAEGFEKAIMQVMDILTENLDALQTMMLDLFYQRYIKKSKRIGEVSKE